MSLTTIQKIAMALIIGLSGWTLKTVQDTQTELRIFGERLRSMDARVQARDDELSVLRDQVTNVKACLDRHVVSDGHVITIRRIERIEDDLLDIRKRHERETEEGK